MIARSDTAERGRTVRVPVPAFCRYHLLRGARHTGLKPEEQVETLERIETRVSPADRARIGDAAAARQESVARFVYRAALREADEVLGREVDVTRMPVAQFEGLLAALDRPAQPIPELVRLASRDRPYIRR